MNVEFKILYKNGYEDVIVIDVENEEDAANLLAVRKIVDNAMQEDIPAVVQLGDGSVSGNIIRVSDVTRFGMTIKETESDESN